MRTQLNDADNSLLIPSVELIGTRQATLLQLDGALSRLNAIRRTLAGGAPRPEALSTADSDQFAVGWWTTGFVVAMLFVLLIVVSWAHASNADGPSTRSVTVVHETY